MSTKTTATVGGLYTEPGKAEIVNGRLVWDAGSFKGQRI
jgi:hypothetical protein